MRQYHPRRSWLWRQWSGTIVRRVLQKEVLFNVGAALALMAFLNAPGPSFEWRQMLQSSRTLTSVDRIWGLCSG